MNLFFLSIKTSRSNGSYNNINNPYAKLSVPDVVKDTNLKVSHKSCHIGKYLDYENCKCRKTLIDKLVEECTENVEEVKLAKISSAENENVCKSFCTIYVVLFSRTFTMNI